MINAFFADMLFVFCKREASYGHILRTIMIQKWRSQLRCWFFDKPYTSYYLMQGGLHRTLKLALEVRQRTTAWILLFDG